MAEFEDSGVPRKVKVCFLVPQDDYDALAEIAKVEQRTVSNTGRVAVHEFIKSRTVKED